MHHNKKKINFVKLAMDIKKVFMTAVAYSEGKITHIQLARTAERTSWNANRLLNDERVPAEDMSLEGVGNVFTHSKLGDRFLAETKEPWVRIQEEREVRKEREALEGPKPDILSLACGKLELYSLTNRSSLISL